MAFSPISVGDSSPLHSSFTTDSGLFSLNGVSGDDMALHFLNTASGDLVIGTGTWQVTNAGAGTADYAPSPTDVSIPGIYQVYPVIQLTSGPKAFDPQILEIRNLP